MGGSLMIVTAGAIEMPPGEAKVAEVSADGRFEGG